MVNRKWGLWLLGVVATLSVLAGCYNALVPANASFDFQWDAALVLAKGFNPYLYTLNHLAAFTDTFMPDPLQANQIPSCLLLLWPYTWLPWPLAKGVWLVTNLAATIGLLQLGSKAMGVSVSNHQKGLIAALFLIGTPFRVTLGNGQHGLWALFFLVSALALGDQKKPWLSGLCLGLSWLKYTLTGPFVLLFIKKKQFAPIAVATGFHLLLTGLASGLTHTSPLTLILQSIAVSKTLTQAGLVDAASLFSPTLALMVSATLVTSTLVYVWKSNSQPHQFMVISLASLLMVYHRIYDFVGLLFILIALVSSAGKDISTRTQQALWATLLGFFWAERAVISLGHYEAFRWILAVIIYTAYALLFIDLKSDRQKPAVVGHSTR
ncbi:MAG: glycosyltransferase family 87 protein [Candidatus Margulisiibacteriota bacterium]